ncbi:MAG: FtsX-like permease family protein [Phycisphaerae bacterium]
MKRRIAYFAIAAVTLCVAMVLIVMSVMGGWLDQVKQRARGLLGDIIVDNRSYSGFPLYQEFIDDVKQWPEVVQATPVIYSYGLIHFKSQTEQNGTVRVVGIRLSEICDVNAFRAGLYYEKFYPGTTHLGDQQQPLVGVDENLAAGKDGRARLVPPSPLIEALEKTRAEGLKDSDSWNSRLNAALRDLGQPPIPGNFDLNESEISAQIGPPTWEGEPWPGVIIGRDIIGRRRSDGGYDRVYKRGQFLTLSILETPVGGNIEPNPRKQGFRYADDSRTGVFDIDSQHVYVEFELLQKLVRMDAADRADGGGKTAARCSQIQIKIKPGVDAETLCRRMHEHYLGLLDDPRAAGLDAREQRLVVQMDALTWEQSQAHIIGPVEKERQLVTTLFGIISLVAIALVLCILYMIVVQKTRDIGIVKSIGGSSGGVATIFVFYGMAVGVVGSILGAVLGCLFVHYINDIQDWLVWVFGWRMWDPAVYAFDRIPDEVDPGDLVRVIVFAILASTIGAAAAAWRAGAMQPVEAIRYE